MGNFESRLPESEPIIPYAVGSLAVEASTVLTRRQTEELELASLGYTAEEAAQYGHYGFETINGHRRKAVNRLQVKNLKQAVRKGIEAKLIPISASPPLYEALTRTEMSILLLLLEGSSYREIGDSRGVAQDTVKSHTKHIYQKLDARNACHAIRRSFELGIVPLDR